MILGSSIVRRHCRTRYLASKPLTSPLDGLVVGRYHFLNRYDIDIFKLISRSGLATLQKLGFTLFRTTPFLPFSPSSLPYSSLPFLSVSLSLPSSPLSTLSSTPRPLAERRFRLAGHIFRLPDHRHSKNCNTMDTSRRNTQE